MLFNEDYGEAREQVFQKWNEHLASIFDKNPKEADMFPTTMVEWAYEYMKNENSKNQIAEQLIINKLENN